MKYDRRTLTLSALLGATLLVGCASARPTPPQASGPGKVYAAALADARRAGIPTRPAELQTPAPPEPENAAPLYTELSKALKAAPLAAQEKEALRVRRFLPPEGAEWEAGRAVLKKRADALNLFRRAAQRPTCVFVRDRSDPMAIQFAEYSAMREGVRMLSVESLLMARDGKAQAAVQNQALAFRTAAHADTEAEMMIAHLVAIALDSIAFSSLQNMMLLRPDDAELADAVRRAVETDWKPRSLARALRSEAGSVVVMVENLRGGGLKRGTELPEFTRAAIPKDATARNAILDENGLEMLRNFRRQISAADAPYAEAAPVFRKITRSLERDDDPRRAFAAILNPVFGQALGKRVQNEAQAAVTCAAASVMAYRARNRRLPARLDEAVNPPPVDPFDGQPIRYRREGPGFVVYSIGASGRYDGGTTSQKPPTQETVFRYPVPPYARTVKP